MYGTLLLAVVLLGLAHYAAAADSCSNKTMCSDCLQLAGCQWCAAEMMWPNSTKFGRCRRRPERKSEGEDVAWCSSPTTDVIDPPDLEMTTPQKPQELVSLDISVSPQRMVVNTRRETVDLVFLIKLDTSNKLEVKLQRKYKNTFQNIPSSYNTSSSVHISNWKVYTVNVTHVKARCGSHELRFSSGGHDVPITLTRPCECDCGRPKTVNSEQCGGRGTLHCGGCECRGDWNGPTCNEWRCPEQHRGDMPSVASCRAPNSDVECSGAGTCKCNSKCVCHEGGNYFDEFCTDFCTATGPCALCYQLRRNDSDFYQYSKDGSGDSSLEYTHKCLGECYGSKVALQTPHGDTPNTGLRIPCRVVDDEGCIVAYSGWKFDQYNTLLRLDGKNCSAPVYAGIGSAAVGLGGVLGAVAGALLVAALVGAAGVALWKSAHKPGDVLSSMQYEHMDAEANQGENPLYKPPTSIYNNPLYQQVKK